MSNKLISVDARELFDGRFQCADSCCRVELKLTTQEIRAIIIILNSQKYGQDKKSG